ncbi:MAG: dihydroorotate dehydrogenase electron transfer subunit [Butyrivibrio sp.]|nr:dihydroorotate dehydrogenase electron transfer subunit [Butyrivibrio sp.]
MKFDETAVVESRKRLSDGIYDMWIRTSNIAEKSVPGQFVSVYSKDGSRLLPRPISICETDVQRLRLVYRVVGKGTKEFSEYQPGDSIHILGPLGNGFPIQEGKKAILIGGGIGIPPMLELAKRIYDEKEIVVGYRNSDTFLDRELKLYGNLTVATDDGSLGTHGTVIDAIKSNGIEGDVIYACGPTPMLRAVKEYAAENGIEAWLSMEERMACGIGACLACVCRSAEIDGHSQVHNKRVCADGPVFNAAEVEL